jgi:predicted nucleotidyltransferase
MGSKIVESSPCGELFGKTRTAVLAFLYGKPDESFYSRQVMDAVKTGRGAVQRELKNLTEKGIITRETRGRQVYYRANDRCPVFEELKGIAAKTLEGAARSAPEVSDLASKRFNVPKSRLEEYCRRNHIRKLALFGSVLRGDFGPDSDIDVLVEFEPGETPGFAFVDMEDELSRMVGRKIDLRTPMDLSQYFRDKVVREARVQYAADKS